VTNRISAVVKRIYKKIGTLARSESVNGVDETRWRQNGRLKWLWTMPKQSMPWIVRFKLFFHFFP